jgi:hypothetical protein
MNTEKIVQEQRTIEAMKKGYMGYEGKFAQIARKFGFDVVQQGSGAFHQTFIDDFYEWGEEEEIPTMDEDEVIRHLGYNYDGYKNGDDLTVNLNLANAEIKVTFEGNMVYKEVAGDLECFVPNELWELKIEAIYSRVLKNDKSKKKSVRQDLVKRSDAKKNEILKRLKDKWGV